MLKKKLATALLAVFGMAAMPLAMAVTRMDVKTGNLGQVAPGALAARIGLGSGDGFVADTPTRTARGTIKVREQQTYRGIPVYGRHLVTERNAAGAVLSVEGVAERGVGQQLASVRPRLDAARAQGALRAAMKQTALPISGATAKLYVYPGRKANAAARLVYLVSYRVDVGGMPARPTAIVDADTGAVLEQWDGLTTGRSQPGNAAPAAAAVSGPGGNTLVGRYDYNGVGAGHEQLSATKVGNTCYLVDDRVATFSLAGGQRVVQWSFGCGGSNPAAWVSAGDAINGAYSPVNDAHHFGSVVHDMYTNWFGEPPLTNPDGSAMQLGMWVHYGTNYENAFWDGSEMVFGDGDQYFFPFVVLDVTGHEISHGFTEQHAGLEYRGQSGGMNEAFSDMAGEAVKFYDRGANDFLVGADMVKPETVPLLGMPALRDMCTPSRDGASIDNAAQYRAGLDVHYSSGVYNRAFCLLAKTSGWDTRKAFEVFHDANALYWGPTETFDSGACGVQQAATDRNYPVADVTAAFAAVGVTCTPAG